VTAPSAPSIRALTRTHRWQDAVAAVRRAIVAGELKAGARISEAQLAEGLSVSRMPVRDAIRVLVQEGLLRQHNGATIVTGFSAADVRQLCDLRLYLESFAVRLVSGRLDAAKTGTLRDEAERMERAAAGHDPQAFTAADIAFHRALCRAADHRWLLTAWETLAPTVETALVLTDTRFYRWPMDETAARHGALLALLTRGDTDAALAALAEQMREPVEVLTAHLGQAYGE
jgi:DNA-binding GntR family transcriptional regulator